MTRSDGFEIIVVGGGIAGASLAYSLTRRGIADVLVLEREEQPGYHATGRSASVLDEADPNPTVRLLKVQGARFLRQPPPGFTEHPLVDNAGVMLLYSGSDWAAIQTVIPEMERAGTRIDLLDREAAVARIPVLEPGQFDGGIFLPEDGHIDVNELLSGYLRHAAAAGVELRVGTEVTGVLVERGRCVGVDTADGPLRARWVVDAAGAWVGVLGQMAGAAPIRFTPHRRTAITFDPPAGLDVRHWPLVADETHGCYFTPESGGLMASPMDRDPMAPCDARPDELGVAQTIDKLTRMAPSLVPRAIRRKWAGLRTFADDDGFVVGPDPTLPGFFWLGGQGGSGIITSAAVGAIAADLLCDGRTDRFDVRLIAPDRFR